MREVKSTFKELIGTGGAKDGWAIRPDFHMTVLFIGGKIKDVQRNSLY